MNEVNLANPGAPLGRERAGAVWGCWGYWGVVLSGAVRSVH